LLVRAVALTTFAACVYGQPSAVPSNAPTVSVGSNIGLACNAVISPAAVQQDLEHQLRSGGITVSKVHSARLSAEVDCVPVTAGAQKPSIAVHQCLALSQVVSRQEQGREAMLATTWRKCQAYTCDNRQCDVLVRTGLRDLANVFIADSHEAVSVLEPLRSAAPPRPAAESTAAGFGGTSLLSKADTVYYVLYILACAIVFVMWQVRGRHAH
jgi:hypothetical protein